MTHDRLTDATLIATVFALCLWVICGGPIPFTEPLEDGCVDCHACER